MRRSTSFVLALALALLQATGPASRALADGSKLIGLQTADEAKGWQSVGKLILGKRGFCTGALIAPQLVLTAAHCLFDKETGARTPDDQISFQAGWRNGRAEAYRAVRRSIAHPEYVYGGEDEMGRIAYDLAILELEQPIQLPQLAPFETQTYPAVGAAVSVVSYAHDRAEVPSIERGCTVLSAQAQALILSCDIDFGSSGAPVFTVENGVARVVSVISAKAEMEGKKVALAVPVDGPLAILQAELVQSEQPHQAAVGVKVLSGGGGGAKFISP